MTVSIQHFFDGIRTINREANICASHRIAVEH